MHKWLNVYQSVLTLDPELFEAWKFFTRWQGGINCQAAGRKAINLTCTNHAEIAGPEHADDFIVFIFAVDRVKHFKTGKTKVFTVSLSC